MQLIPDKVKPKRWSGGASILAFTIVHGIKKDTLLAVFTIFVNPEGDTRAHPPAIFQILWGPRIFLKELVRQKN